LAGAACWALARGELSTGLQATQRSWSRRGCEALRLAAASTRLSAACAAQDGAPRRRSSEAYMPTVRWGSAAAQGQRYSMEDAHIAVPNVEAYSGRTYDGPGAHAFFGVSAAHSRPLHAESTTTHNHALHTQRALPRPELRAVRGRCLTGTAAPARRTLRGGTCSPCSWATLHSRAGPRRRWCAPRPPLHLRRATGDLAIACGVLC